MQISPHRESQEQLRPPIWAGHHRAYRTLVRRLREARLKAGLSQREVARKIDKPQSFVCKIEIGERRLDPIELLVLARLYALEPAELFEDLPA